jgi:hypothetical protein
VSTAIQSIIPVASFIFNQSAITFCFIVVFASVFVQLLLIIMHLYKTSTGFALGRQGGNSTTHFAVCV